MEVTLLGTGAPLAPARATMGLLVTAPGCEPLLVDTCGGFELARQLAAADFALSDLRNVVVTHRHLDHAGGVPALLLADTPLTFYAGADALAGMRDLARACFPEWRANAGVAYRAIEPATRYDIGGFAVEFFTVQHRVPTLAVRVSHGGKSLAFSADSLPCDALIACAREADLFVCDALFAALDGAELVASARQLMHPVAREAAEMATYAGVGRLALVHVGRHTTPEHLLAEAAPLFHGPLGVPDDGQRFAL